MVYSEVRAGRQMKSILFLLMSLLFIAVPASGAGEDPVTKLKDDAMAYFKPQTGKVVRLEDGKVFVSIGEKEGVKPGMRLRVLREGAAFVHPVTHELLGNVESTVGKIEIKDVQSESSSGNIVEGDAKEGDRVRLSETKIRLFFSQAKSIEWYLADDFYRKLKATGRIEMIDTALDTEDEATVLAEAKKSGAEVALLVSGKEAEKAILMRVRLFWVADGAKFFDTETTMDAGYVKDLKFGEEFFAPQTAGATMSFDLTYGARFIAVGDLYGDGKKEVILSTGTDLRIYLPGVDLKQMGELKGGKDDHLWIDTIDLNNDGKDEIILTSMRNGEVVSSVYGVEGGEFKKLWEGNYFLRRLGDGLIGQAFLDGYSGDIFTVRWDGGVLTKGDSVKTPKGVNIYDFAPVTGGTKEKAVLAYDDDGYLNLYDEKGTRVWRSGLSNGGFITTFKKQSPTVMAPSVTWSVKDRLLPLRGEVLAVRRVPLAEMARGFGYKKSEIRGYWWNGFSMEEGVLVDGVGGSIRDYALAGDQLMVLASPFMGVKFGNILKGENPLGVVLYIYSVKGR
ncbi:conserved exported hypothetical protein [Candidatus Sulfobium mesophilum]|uniref:VCBS repeat-containing protein n=1 Tax=Candidatus Sulfobium mesophilum TaxID=2016548 RepID=A0A2U3QK84_9BACT|nr:conserved exported hypothetical protein [Candidatus Sulfobium mesophilum]